MSVNWDVRSSFLWSFTDNSIHGFLDHPLETEFPTCLVRLNSTAMWVQLHHLPMECWHTDSLETIGDELCRLLKVDDLTLSSSRDKFAWICAEIDLSKPLTTGLWVNFRGNLVIVAVFYEKLIFFCYNFGLISHIMNSCTFTSGSSVACASTLAWSNTLHQPE